MKKREDEAMKSQMELQIENRVLKELLLARERQLAQTPTPPVQTPPVLKVVGERPAKQRAAPKELKGSEPDVDWTKVKTTCRKCGHKGTVFPDFGTRMVRGRRLKQAWCSRCRATTNYRHRPRKNTTQRMP